jgi:ABC-type transport system involved in multi-copper enzyme maturation permease subunit
MTTTIAPYRSSQRPGRDGFAQLLWAEWTKFRTVRAWAIVLIAAAVLGALATIALATAAKASGSDKPIVSVDSNGQAVTDQFSFVDQTLTGNGSITVAVTSLTGGAFAPLKPGMVLPSILRDIGVQPWAKAGLIIKASLKSGSAYAAVMVTGAHGVRMQYDYTHDIAGQPGLPSARAPAWLRLTRSDDSITGYDSADGKHWTRIGTVTMAGLPATVQAGLVATSPGYNQSTQGLASNNGTLISTQATGTFEHLSRQGSWPAGTWTESQVGLRSLLAGTSGSVDCGLPSLRQCAIDNATGQAPKLGARASGGTFTVTGTGDIAPYEATTDPLGLSFKGTLVGLIAVIALGAAFITAEYRRGMIRTTFAASPRRGRVLVAKVLVMGVITFVAGLIGAAAAFEIGQSKLNSNGWPASVYPIRSLFSAHGLQMVVGTAGIFALTAILAIAAGATIRRSAGAIAAVIGAIIVPLILATLLPATVADWLLRLTPAAAFSVQLGNQYYPQVSHVCLPYNGCYPLSPWYGFGVLAIWAVLAMGGAIYLVRRRDA